MSADETQGLLDRACRHLSAGGGTVRVVGEMANAIQSRVWQLAVTDASREHSAGERLYALKHFRPDYTFTNAAAVRDEYTALQALAGALAGEARRATGVLAVRCPEPVAVWDQGYLMTWEAGIPLRSELTRPRYDRAARAAIARALVGAVADFHRCRQAAFADFHSGNVLVAADGSLVLIDPNPANPGFYAGPIAAHPPMAVDIAYWVFTEATRAVRRSVTEPRASWRRLALARALWRRAGIDADPTLSGPFADCVRTFTARLAARGARQRFIALGAGAIVAAGWRPTSGAGA